MVVALAPAPLITNQPSISQYLQMLRNRWPKQLELADEMVDRVWPVHQEFQNSPANRVCQNGENIWSRHATAHIMSEISDVLRQTKAGMLALIAAMRFFSLGRNGLRLAPPAVVNGLGCLDLVRAELNRADPIFDEDPNRLGLLRT